METSTPRIFETQDGSHSVFADALGVSYHSRYGAVQESRHVFIDAGLSYGMSKQPSVDVLEIGFGTGLNAFMSLLEAEKRAAEVSYTTVEAFPVSIAEARQLNYPDILESGNWRDHFLLLHTLPWGETHRLSPHFHFQKLWQRFEELDFQDRFDVIYFDAFAPGAQPELWEVPVMEIMYKALRPGGILTTYCAKGAVKRTLKSIGFVIEALPGPPGKREMTRAVKP